MVKLLYTFSLLLYRIGLHTVAAWNNKARLFIEGRKGILTKAKQVNPDKKPLLWMHCASLGEFEQGRPLLEQFRLEFPHHLILVTFFSPSGYEIQKKYAGADHILYLPVDGPKNARKFINSIQPTLAIFVKYEFWYYYFAELNRLNIPLLSVSSIFRKSQLFFKPYGAFHRKILSFITQFFVQDYQSAQLLESIGYKNIVISGDTRFDRVFSISQKTQKIPEIPTFISGRKCFIVGSAWSQDMEVIVPFINDVDFAFIIAPHVIDEAFLMSIERDIEKPTTRFSSLSQLNATADVLLIDNIGMLSSLYQYGDFAWIGGAFGSGLHNILEPAVFGLPLFFGNKNYTKFKEARDLVNMNGAFPVSNYNELKENFKHLNTGNNYEIVQNTNQQYVQSHLGATDKVLDFCRKQIQS